MKKVLSLLVIVFVIFGSALLASCGCGNSNNGNIALSKTMFAGYKASIGSAVALGIVNTSQSSIQASSTSVVRASSANDEKKNKMIAVAEDNKYEEIIFERVIPQYNEKDTITQDEIKAEFDKLYITELYVYFTLTINTVHRTESSDYDQEEYISDSRTQSFLIDRVNGHVYSLAALGNISFIEGNFVRVGGNWYHLAIEQDQIKFRDLVPNKNVTVNKVQIDKNGIIFVENSSINQITDDVIYYTQGLGGYGYSLGSDGNFYRLQTYNGGPFYTEAYVFNGTSWELPDFSAVIYIPGTIWQNDGLLIKNGKVYAAAGNTYYVLKGEVNEGVFCISYINPDDYYGSAVHSYSDGNFDKIYIVDENVHCLVNGEVFVYITDLDETTKKTTSILQNISSVEIYKDYCLYIKQESDGTKKYKVYVESNEVICNLVSSELYNPNIIIIKPLF